MSTARMVVAIGSLAKQTCVFGYVDNLDGYENFLGDNFPPCRREFTNCNPENFNLFVIDPWCFAACSFPSYDWAELFALDREERSIY